MRCPRCQAELQASARACPRCGAPLRLGEEATGGPLDRPLDLDRRAEPRGEVGPPGGRPGGPPPAEPTETLADPWSRGPVAGPTRRPRTTPAFWKSPDELPAPAEPAAAPPAPPPPAPPPLRAPAPPGRRVPAPGRAPAPAGPPTPAAAAGAPRTPPPEAMEPAPGPVPSPAEPVAALPVADEPGDLEILGPGEEETTREGPRPPPRAPEAPAPGEPAPEPRAIELHFVAASRGQRLLSWAVDGILAAALAWLLVAGGARVAAGGPWDGVPPVPTLALAGLLHLTHAALGCALAGRTLGKWVAGLEVVGPDGRLPSPGRAALRTLLSLLSAGVAGIGLLVALADRMGRAPHDRIARTAVVRSP